MKFIFIAFGLILYFFSSFSQEKYKPLKLGDTVPDIVFDLLNRPRNPSMKLSQFKGRLLIIDCWSIYCVPCVRALPELAELQKIYTSSINILTLEGGTSKEKVQNFLKNRKKNHTEIELPVAHIGYKKRNEFSQLFPILNNGFPVEIWINEKGILIGVTGGRIVNKRVIGDVLNGNTDGLYQKHYQKNFNRNAPFLLKNNGGVDSAFLYRSLITPFIDSIQGGGDLIINRNSKMTRIFAPNKSISDLIKIAYYRSYNYDPYNKQLSLQVRNPELYLAPINDENARNIWKKQGYCYELILPENRTIDEAFDKMLSDLKSYFKVTIATEKKEVNCLILEKSGNDILKAESGEKACKINEGNSSTDISLKNSDFNIFFSYLNNKKYPLVINKTGINYPVDIIFKIPAEYNLVELQKNLNRIGLRLKEEKISTDLLVITEN